MPKMFAVVLLVFFSVNGAAVSAQTHHVVGGDGGWSSSVSGRVFRVGDKIWFSYPATKENILELQSLEEFLSCNLTNPIRMYTDDGAAADADAPVVTLDKEGVRYFTSGDTESCKNGLKLPVIIHSQPEFEPPPRPFHGPPPSHRPPGFIPPPPFIQPPPAPAAPSASNNLNGFSFLVFAGLTLCHVGL